MSASRPHLTALTGVRFLAAAHVVAYHFGDPYLSSAPGWLRSIVHQGQGAVGVFFILSGFVLSYTYLHPAAPPVDARKFWIARFARIYPAYLFAVVLAGPFVVRAFLESNSLSIAGIKTLGLGVLVLALAQAWSPKTALVWNSPGWSLSAEAFFYAVFPLCASRIRGWSRRALLRGVGALTILSFIPVAGYLLLDPTAGDGRPGTFGAMFVTYFPLFRLPEFLIGVLLGIHFLKRTPVVDAHGAHRGALLAGVGTSVVLIGLATADTLDGRAHLIMSWSIMLSSAVLIYGLALGRGAIAGLLSSRYLGALGEAGYSLYLLQLPIWLWCAWLADHLAPIAPPEWSGTFLLVYCAALLGGSMGVYRLIENPARVWLRGMFAGAVDSHRGERVAVATARLSAAVDYRAR